MKRTHFSFLLSLCLGLGLLVGCGESTPTQISTTITPETALKEKLTAIDKACFYIPLGLHPNIDEEGISEEDTEKIAKLRDLEEKTKAASQDMDSIEQTARYDTLCEIARVLKSPIPFSRETYINVLNSDNHSEQRAYKGKLTHWEKALRHQCGTERFDTMGMAYASRIMLPASSALLSARIEMKRLLSPKTMEFKERVVNHIEAQFRQAAKHDATIRREMDENWKHVKLAILSDNRQLVSGWIMLLQINSSESNKEDLVLLKQMAEAGDAEAQCLLGMQYEGRSGWLIHMDDIEDRKYFTAVSWFKKAADKGNAEALARLSRAYHNGDGVEQSSSKSKQYASMAMEQGNFLGFAFLMNSDISDYQKNNAIRQMMQTSEAWLIPIMFPRQYKAYSQNGTQL